LTFGVARGAAGFGTGVFAVGGTSVWTGAAGGGADGFTLEASALFSGVAGGGTGAESGDETATGGGLSVPREHALSPIPSATATIK
jgi:hypothetical protein